LEGCVGGDLPSGDAGEAAELSVKAIPGRIVASHVQAQHGRGNEEEQTGAANAFDGDIYLHLRSLQLKSPEQIGQRTTGGAAEGFEANNGRACARLPPVAEVLPAVRPDLT
jgi:hypothetical protein